MASLGRKHHPPPFTVLRRGITSTVNTRRVFPLLLPLSSPTPSWLAAARKRRASIALTVLVRCAEYPTASCTRVLAVAADTSPTTPILPARIRFPLCFSSSFIVFLLFSSVPVCPIFLPRQLLHPFLPFRPCAPCGSRSQPLLWCLWFQVSDCSYEPVCGVHALPSYLATQKEGFEHLGVVLPSCGSPHRALTGVGSFALQEEGSWAHNPKEMGE